MKIYVITKGECDDYHICAATTDKDRAELLKRMASSYGAFGEEAKIEEHDDYAGLTLIDGDLYEVEAEFDSRGKFVSVYASRTEYVEHQPVVNSDIRYEEEGWGRKVFKRHLRDWGRILYTAYVVAPSEDKAEKIGIDMIQEYRSKEMGLSV